MLTLAAGNCLLIPEGKLKLKRSRTKYRGKGRFYQLRQPFRHINHDNKLVNSKAMRMLWIFLFNKV